MAADYLLEIDGIKGESKDDKHKDAIDIQSFSWGVSNPGSFAGGGGGGGGGGRSGRATFQDIHFSSSTSKASPQLFLACATGKHIAKATLFVRKAGGQQENFLTITLSDVLVSSFAMGNEGGSSTPAGVPAVQSDPRDQFSLDYRAIEVAVAYQGPTGAPQFEKAGYDIKQQKAV